MKNTDVLYSSDTEETNSLNEKYLLEILHSEEFISELKQLKPSVYSLSFQAVQREFTTKIVSSDQTKYYQVKAVLTIYAD